MIDPDFNQDGMISQPEMAQALIMQSQQTAELLRWQLENADIVEAIEHLLKGQLQGIDGKWVGHGVPKMNDQGIREVLTLLTPFTSKNVLLSNFSVEEICSLMLRFEVQLVDMLYVNLDGFGMRIEDLNSTKEIIVMMVWSAVKRAQNAGERNLIGLTQRRVEQITNNVGGQRKGAVGSLSGWFGGQ